MGIFASLSPLETNAEPPLKASEGAADPGRSIVSDDDASSIKLNPANLAFMQGPEFRFSGAWADNSRIANGFSLSAAAPIWILGTGLRFDVLDTSLAPRGTDSLGWFRWALGARAGDSAAFGTTFSWSHSDSAAQSDFFSITSGLSTRLNTSLAVSFVARDWNAPENPSGNRIERSFDLGFAVRPVSGHRAFELGLEGAYYDESSEWVPRVTAGIDVPRLGRLRGDISFFDTEGRDPTYLATAGLDLNLGATQVSGGAIFGEGSGPGYYLGGAIRSFREPGARLPKHYVRLEIDSTPGVRKHTRLLRRLWRYANDPEVEGVVLMLRDEPASSFAHAEELADAIRGLRQQGKKVLCHLEDAGSRSLFVCSAADRIAMNPAGGLRFAGLASSYFYFGDLLKKLSVRADFVRIGEHKLAAEQFARADGSPVAGTDHQELLDVQEGVFLHDVGGGRRIPVPVLKERIAKGPFLAREARDNGLIDTLAYKDEVERVVEEMEGGPVRITDASGPTMAPSRWGQVPKIAVIYLSGDMVDGDSQHIPVLGVRLAGSATISKALRRAREDQSVRAVVFRISTGGGSSLAADVILREAILTAKKKPLIVSMGSAAASGGYYASMAGQTIFANRTTVTGSIGIFYGKVDVSGLLEKIGVHVEQFRTAPRADAESLFRPFTDDERRELGVKVKQFYDTFIGRVAEGRKMAPNEVDRVARGKVWTGSQAVERRLVDKIGGLRDALWLARDLGGLPDDAPIVELPEEDDSLLGFLLNLAGLSEMKAALGTMPPLFVDVARALSPFLVFDGTRPLARMELTTDISSEYAGDDSEQ